MFSGASAGFDTRGRVGRSGSFPLRPRFLIRCSRWRAPATSCAFLTPLLMFFEIFHPAIAVRMIPANFVIVCAVFAVAATAPTPKVTNHAAMPIAAVAASSTARSFRMPFN